MSNTVAGLWRGSNRFFHQSRVTASSENRVRANYILRLIDCTSRHPLSSPTPRALVCTKSCKARTATTLSSSTWTAHSYLTQLVRYPKPLRLRHTRLVNSRRETDGFPEGVFVSDDACCGGVGEPTSTDSASVDEWWATFWRKIGRFCAYIVFFSRGTTWFVMKFDRSRSLPILCRVFVRFLSFARGNLRPGIGAMRAYKQLSSSSP